MQPEPENAEDKNAVAVVMGHIPFRLANTKHRTKVTHFLSKPNNQGSVDVERQSIGMEVLVGKYHVFTFLMVLGNTWIYLNNY